MHVEGKECGSVYQSAIRIVVPVVANRCLHVEALGIAPIFRSSAGAARTGVFVGANLRAAARATCNEVIPDGVWAQQNRA